MYAEFITKQGLNHHENYFVVQSTNSGFRKQFRYMNITHS